MSANSPSDKAQWKRPRCRLPTWPRPSSTAERLYRPHIVEAVRSPRGKIIKRFDSQIIRKVNVTAESLREVRAGMAKVTDPGGTAYGLKVDGVPFSGKTGTAEIGVNGSSSNTTWFIAFAPTDHPTSSRWRCTWNRPAATAPALRHRSRNTSSPSTSVSTSLRFRFASKTRWIRRAKPRRIH
jgi:penicillin-binding protein 2